MGNVNLNFAIYPNVIQLFLIDLINSNQIIKNYFRGEVLPIVENFEEPYINLFTLVPPMTKLKTTNNLADVEMFNLVVIMEN